RNLSVSNCLPAKIRKITPSRRRQRTTLCLIAQFPMTSTPTVTKSPPALIPPAGPTPCGTLPFSSIDKTVAGSGFVNLMQVFPPPSISAARKDQGAVAAVAAMRNGFARALVPYYPVAGRIASSRELHARRRGRPRQLPTADPRRAPPPSPSPRREAQRPHPHSPGDEVHLRWFRRRDPLQPRGVRRAWGCAVPYGGGGASAGAQGAVSGSCVGPRRDPRSSKPAAGAAHGVQAGDPGGRHLGGEHRAREGRVQAGCRDIDGGSVLHL
uniref:Uncharacterized protein n=1 Tax=Aegilops tauschii subsp. strangulata TaxID=200361 RepID=A0A453S1M2_AEGTS